MAQQAGFFLLLQRGGCSFSEKVKNAQAFGAEVVLISDYRDEVQEQQFGKIDGHMSGQLQSHIPAFELEFEDAKHIVETIFEDKLVYLKADFDVTNQENTVEVDLWYATSLDLGITLSEELAAMSLSFTNDHSHKPLFTPRIATYSCVNCEDDFKVRNCLSNGAYCGYTPNFYKEYNLEERGVSMTGREVLTQALREKCLHQIMSTKYKDEGDIFWTFFGYLSQCFLDENGNLKDHHETPKSFDECYDWSTVKIENVEEVDNLNDCFDRAFAVKGDIETDNEILRDDRVWANANHIKLHPSITINNITYTNSTGEDLALAICSAYN